MSKRKEKRAFRNAIPFMLPSLVGMIVFSLLPILISIVISFTKWNGLDRLAWKTLADNFVFLDNFWTNSSNLLQHKFKEINFSSSVNF